MRALDNEVQAWIAKAEEDLLLATLAMEQTPPLLYGATFHAQQCAEKYLKALLAAHGRTPPRTHDLVALTDLGRNIGLEIAINDDLVSLLTQFGAQVRYPGNEPTLEDAKTAIRIAQTIRRVARALLVGDESDSF